jgi:hypothetical protein
MIYWEVIAATGWSFEYLDDVMTLPRLLALTGCWKEAPPIRLMLAGFVGAGKKKEVKPHVNDFDALMNMPGFVQGI